MYEVIAVTKALADENRVRLLAAIGGGEMCVCELIDMIGLAPSTVSKHLSILRSARLIEGRKSGRWMHYRLADGQAPVMVISATKWLLEHIKDSPCILNDRQRMQTVKTNVRSQCCMKTRRLRIAEAIRKNKNKAL